MKKVFILLASFVVSPCFLSAPNLSTVNAAPIQDDQSVEETLDELGRDVEDSLEHLAESLERSTEQWEEQFEQWAEKNADELDAWAAKYSGQWEDWSLQMERKMDGVAQEIARKILADGLDELSHAPWESLAELGDVAEDALTQSLAGLKAATEQGSEPTESVQQALNELQRALARANKGFEGQGSRGPQYPDIDLRLKPHQPTQIPAAEKINAKLKALNELLKREGLSDQQRLGIEHAIATLKDAKTEVNRGRDRTPVNRENAKRDSDKNRRDQDSVSGERKIDREQNGQQEIRAKIAAEQRRHAERMKDLESSLHAEEKIRHKKTETNTPPATEMELLRKQLELLRKEVQELKKSGSKR